MSPASAQPPHPEPGVPESRPSEPSMEDILASIRRIIADDQQASGGRGSSRRPPAATSPGVPATGPRADSSARGSEEVLDLARYVPGLRAGTTHPEPALDEGAASGRATAIALRQAEPHHAEAEATPMPSDDEHRATEAGHEPLGFSEDYEPAGEVPEGDVGLLAAPLTESVMSAFEALAATVVLENKPMLERVLRDLLRPLVKTWLDDNLPSLVERLVRNEIERVARGARS